MSYFYIILAILIGYYIGNRQQLKHDRTAIKKKITETYNNITTSKEIKKLPKREPKSEMAEILTKLQKKDAQN